MGKAGRKRKAGKREPSGKLSRRVGDKQARRTIDEQAAMQVGKEARQRVLGVSAADSGTELAGTICGRLLLQGSISREHMDAALAFQQTYAQFQRAMDSPRQPKAVQIGAATGGEAHDMSPAQAKVAIANWKNAKDVLHNVDIEARGTCLAYAACDYIVLQDRFLPHMFGDLRLGLNALARHYGLVAKRAA